MNLSKKVFIFILMLIISVNLFAADGFDFKLNNSQLEVTSKRSLNYGLLSKDEFLKKDNSFQIKFINPIMIERQPAFFNLENLLKKDASMTTTSTYIPFENIAYSGTSKKEYMLFTEFDDISKPSVLNYATIFSIALDNMSQGYGRKLYDATEKKLKKTTEVVSKIKDATAKTNAFIKDQVEAIDTFLYLAGEEEERKTTQDILEIVNTIDNVLNMTSMSSHTALVGEHSTLRSMFSRIYRSNLKFSQRLPSEKNAVYLKAIAFEILLTRFLESYSKDGKFYYPKDFKSFHKVINNFNDPSLESIEVWRLARQFNRIAMGHKNISSKNKNIVKIASMMIVANNLHKLKEYHRNSSNILNQNLDLSHIIKNVSHKVRSINMATVMNFSKKITMNALDGLKGELDDLLFKFSSRVAQYAIPGSGWARAIADLAKLGNTGGKFAYDFITAPKEVPFSIKNGKVGTPFSIDMKKYSYLLYPDGVNGLDDYSDGSYTYNSYFLYGNAPRGYFNSSNINNRDATLAVSGVVYSYEMKVGEYDNNGKTIHDKLSSENFVGDAPVGFEFTVYKNALGNKSIFTGKTGVRNKHVGYLDQSDFIKNVLNNSSSLYEFKDSDTSSKSKFYYLSYLENISKLFKQDYSGAYWQNYLEKKGIKHTTPGIYEIETKINIKPTLNSVVSQNTVFKDSHKMFILAPVSQGYKTNVYGAKSFMIPYLGLVNSNNDDIGGRWFEYDKKTGQYFLCFKINEEQKSVISTRGSDIKIALYHRDIIKDKNINNSFYTLKSTDGVKDTYKIPVQNLGYFIGEDINTSKPLVMAWIDNKVEDFSLYSGIPLENIVENFHTNLKAELKKSTPTSAIYKAFSYRAFSNGTKVTGYDSSAIANQPIIDTTPIVEEAITLYTPSTSSFNTSTNMLQSNLGSTIKFTLSEAYDLNEIFTDKYNAYKVWYKFEDGGIQQTVGKYDSKINGISFIVNTSKKFNLIRLDFPYDYGYGSLSYLNVKLPQKQTVIKATDPKDTISYVRLISETHPDNSVQELQFTKNWVFDTDLTAMEVTADVVSNTYGNSVSKSDININGKTVTLTLSPNTSVDLNKVELQLKNRKGNIVKVSGASKFYSLTKSKKPVSLVVACASTINTTADRLYYKVTYDATSSGNEIKPTITVYSEPKCGTVKVHPDNNGIYYRKPDNYDGTDTFRVKFSYGGEEIIKSVTVNVVKKENATIVVDSGGSVSKQTNPYTSLSAYYDKENDEFKVSWSSKDTDSLEILYSFDNADWTRFIKADLNNFVGSSSTKKLSGTSIHSKIYFKAISKKDTKSITSSTLPISYKTLAQSWIEKETEPPTVPNLSDSTITITKNTTTLSWKRVNDSKYKDNVVKYEVLMADNYRFNNASTINAGNNAAGKNIYESCSYTINNLQDDKSYYFKVRAYNNYNGGTWSNYSSYKKVKVELEDLPVFQTTGVYPSNSATSITKTPILRWDANDADGDTLKYYVRLGEDPNKLNHSSGWLNDEEYKIETEDMLKPNTKYYWQVMLREDGHYKDYYGGEYIKSPIRSFTTVNEGTDLAIVNAELLTELKPDEQATFKVTIKNLGDKVAQREHVKAYYKKNGQLHEFRYKGWGSMLNKTLAPGESEDVNITVSFRDGVITYNEKTYDNVLIEGDSHIVFKFKYPSEQDINSANNEYEKKITYANQGKPKFDYFYVGNRVVYNGEYDFPLYSNLGKNIGRLDGVVFEVDDDILVTKATIEYRVNENDSWHLIHTATNENNSLYVNFDWTIPEEDQFITDSMQVRVRAYENDTSYTEKISYPFPVYSNKLNITNIKFDKPSYTVGDKVTVTYQIDNDYTVNWLTADLKSGTRTESDILEELYYKNGGQPNGIFSFTIPDNNKFANENAYLAFGIRDIHSNSKSHSTAIISPTFEIKANTKLEAPFNKSIQLFSLPDLPIDASYPNQSVSLKSVRLDTNNIVHIIMNYEEKYFKDTQSGNTPDEYNYLNKNYYMTYNPSTKTLSEKIEIPDGDIKSMELNDNNIPYILIENGRQLFYSYKSGTNFVTKKNLFNPIIPSASSSYITTVDNSYNDIEVMRGSIYHNGKVYTIDGIDDDIYSYDFSNGYFSNKIKNNLSGDTTRYDGIYKPISIDNKIYFVADDESKLIEINVDSKEKKAYNLPYTINNDDIGNRSVAIANGGGNLYLFMRGEVYKLGTSLIKVSDIQYVLDGETVSLNTTSTEWNSYVDYLYSVSGNDKIYLIIDLDGRQKKPNLFSSYEILEFDFNSETFSKNIIDVNDLWNGFKSIDTTISWSYSGSVKDYIYIGNDKLLTLSTDDSPFSSVKYYVAGLNMLDLKTGDLISLGSLNIPAKNSAKFIKETNGDIYIVAETYDYSVKTYKINLHNIDTKLKYFDDHEIKKYNNKLMVSYRYGKEYDGKYSGTKVGTTYYDINRVNRLNRIIEVYPNKSGELTLSSEYIGYQWNYSGNKIYAGAEGKIYSTNTDGTINSLSYEDTKFDGGGGYSYSYTENKLATMQKYSSNIEIIDSNLGSHDIGLMNKAGVPISYLYDDYILFARYNSNNYQLSKYVYDQNITNNVMIAESGESSNIINNLIHSNINGYTVVGWDAYLAVANFSEDIQAPQLNLSNKQTSIENSTSITLDWNATDNDDELVKYEIKKVVDGIETLLDTITNIQTTSYTHTVNESSHLIELKVIAYDLTGNTSEVSLPLQITKKINFNSFSVNKTALNLGEKIIFSWSSDGDNSTRYDIYKKKSDDTNWTKLLTTTGGISKSYTINDFIGTYDFKIVSGEYELVYENSVAINGEILKFNNELFTPKGNYFSSENIINLQWSDTLTSTIPYNVLVKVGDGNYTIVGETTNKYFEYTSDLNNTFKWKITAEFDGNTVTSDEIQVIPSILSTPTISNVNFAITNSKPTINLVYDMVENAKEYIIQRADSTNSYQTIDTVSTTSYNDTDVAYGQKYSYKVIAKNGEYESEPSTAKEVSTEFSDSYTVKINHTNYQTINGNAINFDIEPEGNSTINYESYEVQIGTDIEDMKTYEITNDRNISIEDLDYGTTYYVDIYPVDFALNRLSNIPSRLVFTTGFDTRIITTKPQITVGDITSDSISLSWTYIDEASEYLVCKSEENSDFECFTTVKENEYKDTGLKSGVNYRYIVSAINNNGRTISDPTIKTKTLLDDYTKVIKDKEALVFELIKLKNNTDSNITSNLNLMSKGAFGSDITWVTSDISIVSKAGIVNTPNQDTNIAILAMIQSSDMMEIKQFNITVKAKTVEIVESTYDEVNLPKGTTIVSANIQTSSLPSEVQVAWSIKDGIWSGYTKDANISDEINEAGYTALSKVNDSEGLIVVTNDTTTINSNKNDVLISDKTYPYGWSLHGTNKTLDATSSSCKTGSNLGAVLKLKGDAWSIYMPDSTVPNLENFTYIYPNEGYMVWCNTEN